MPRRSRLQKLACMLELPDDVILDLPKITLLGDRQALIENHRGLVEYSPSVVRVNLSRGSVSIKGRNLALGCLESEQLLIEGQVEELRYDT